MNDELQTVWKEAGVVQMRYDPSLGWRDLMKTTGIFTRYGQRPYRDSNLTKLKLNYVALVRERTIPTERPPLVGEVSANLCGCCVVSATYSHCR
jgi:hypothetical protein